MLKLIKYEFRKNRTLLLAVLGVIAALEIFFLICVGSAAHWRAALNDAWTAEVMEARSRGVTVLCTAHGGTFEELLRRKGMQRLFAARTFGRYVRLTGCGKADEIRDEEGNRL